MVNRIILLSFLLGATSTVAVLLWLLLSVEGEPKKRKSKERSEPSNVRKLYPDISEHMKQAAGN